MVSTRLQFPCRLAVAMACCLALFSAPKAIAVIGTADVTPAATLLVPYFEVDLSSDEGVTTVLTVTNTDAAPTLAHVVLWTDMAVPTLTFDISLTGFDVAAFNLRDLFTIGVVASGDQLSQQELLRIVAAHTGQPEEGTTTCSATEYGDSVVRGYITIDNVNQESTAVPSTAGYFVAGGAGIASNNNVLMGDYLLADLANNFAQGDAMVHIEASSSDTRVTTAGNYTFYGTSIGNTAADNREPLPTTWSAPYSDGGDESASTNLVYWRDIREVGATFECGATPPWFPLGLTQVVVFDDAENAVEPTGAEFPRACGRLAVNAPSVAGNVSSPYESGWIYVNLNSSIADATLGNIAQSFVSVVKSRLGIFSTGHEATALSQAVAP